MAAQRLLLVGAVLVSSLVAACHGDVVKFSDLQKSLVVTASPRQGQVLKAGDDEITVTWGLNQSLIGNKVDTSYKAIEVKLCYAPISQKDRPWRKTVLTDLAKDKTCQFNIVSEQYTPSMSSSTWKISKDIPTGVYFVRAYAYTAQGKEVAFGQTTDANKTSNLFEIQAISGRHASLDIAASVFSAFSLVSLVFFFYAEKRKAMESAQAR